MLYGTNFCKIAGYSGRDFKWPSLDELYFHCFHVDIKTETNLETHNAKIDAAITAKCFFYLKKMGIITN